MIKDRQFFHHNIDAVMKSSVHNCELSLLDENEKNMVLSLQKQNWERIDSKSNHLWKIEYIRVHSSREDWSHISREKD